MSETTPTPSNRWVVLAIYLVASGVALLVSLDFTKASLHNGEYHPVGNDAFYHARRIIDTAGERGFYAFDDTIHVPEGSEIVWPWGFDWVLGQSLSVWQAANPGAHPMAFLAFVPPVLLLLNVALFFALTGAVGLSLAYRAVAVFAYALFPFTQLLHGVGAVDHHMVEHAFALASVLLAVRWVSSPKSTRHAVGLGLVLGTACAFHSALFILQLPVLLGLAILWLRNLMPDARSSLGFAIALVVSTVLVALPSPPLRQFTFDFSLLSWFHVYVSLCTAVMVVLASRVSYSKPALVRLLLVAGALGVPILWVAGTGVDFIRGDIVLLDRVEEMQSPVGGLLGDRFATMWQLYSALIVFLPILLLWSLWFAARSRTAAQIQFAAAAAFGLLLLATQIRLQYFGSFALLIVPLLLLQQVLPERIDKSGSGVLIAVVIFALSFQRPLAQQLFSHQALGLDVDYAVAIDAFPVLQRACAEDTGLALVSTNFGHPVRYHSDCTVIANNFLLTPLHEQKVRELDTLWETTPSDLLDAPQPVRYVLVALQNIYQPAADGVRLSSAEELTAANPPLALALTQETIPAGYQILFERRLGDPANDRPIVRLLAITTN
ncbi:MAG: hypothetical protein AAF290_17145 [Pseudomonadota bacterium]